MTVRLPSSSVRLVTAWLAPIKARASAVMTVTSEARSRAECSPGTVAGFLG